MRYIPAVTSMGRAHLDLRLERVGRYTLYDVVRTRRGEASTLSTYVLRYELGACKGAEAP